MLKMTKKINKILILSMAIMIMGTCSMDVNAKEIISKEYDNENCAIGGWSEENGYYTNLQSYAKAFEYELMSSEPKHTGKAEQQTIDGTTHKRAHGWTTWVGVYHYTRARMVDGDTILTDSERQWGNDGTEAISPWWKFQYEIVGSAKTYYGK